MSKKIMACIDGSPYSTAVCDWAVYLHQRLGNPVSLLHVLEKSSEQSSFDLSGYIGLGSRENLLDELVKLDEQRSKLNLEQGKLLLNAVKKYVTEKGVTAVETRQRHGNLVESLQELADETQVIIIGHHGKHGLSRVAQIGSQVETVIRTQSKAILVAQNTFTAPQKMLFAYDGSPTSQIALEKIIGTGLLQGIPSHIVTVGAEHRQALQEGEQQLKRAGINTHAAVLEGDIEKALWSYVDEHKIDLMVMGAYGHARIRQFLVGSNTTKMLTSTKIPLVLIR